MEPDTYRLIYMAVQDGINIGIDRAYKHDDEPSRDIVVDHIHNAVMHEIGEWFKFKTS